MSRRSRWLLWITVAFVTGILIVWSILVPGGRMAVTVVFVGYTNTPITYNRAAVGGGSITSTIPLGMLMVTNTGSVPVKIYSEIRSDTRTNTSNCAPPIYPGLVGPLRPGDAVVFYALAPDSQQPWWTELAYCRYGLGMRVQDNLWNTGSSFAQGLSKQLSRAAKKQWAQSGWVTNPPPLVASPEFLWAASPPTRAPAPVRKFFYSVPATPNLLGVDQPVAWLPSDFVDASRPPGRYHITAPPPDWKDIDWQGINPSAPISTPRQ